jgi:putative transposase
MALRWTGAAMIEAANGFRRLKAHKHLPSLRVALLAHQAELAAGAGLDPVREAA